MADRAFCSELCSARGEPHAGTGNAPERVLLMPWPRGKWRRQRWESVDMSPELGAAVQHALQNGVHFALTDRVGDAESLPGLMAQPESVYADFDSEADLIAAIRAYVDDKKVFAGTVDPRVTIMVCTDSRRDACCARYGFSTYKALTAIADPSRFNIVQASHLGGCRFAASLVVLPQRQRYGRMTAGQAPAFLEALLRNEVFVPAYKGRTDQPEPVQVAELAALEWAEGHSVPPRDVRLATPDLPENPAEGAELTFGAAAGSAELEIRLKAKHFLVQGNCGIVADGGGTDTLRWCLDRLTETKTHTEPQGPTP